MRVSGGGPSAPNTGLKRTPAVHCTRLVSSHVSKVAGSRNKHRKYDAESGRNQHENPEPTGTKHAPDGEGLSGFSGLAHMELTILLRHGASQVLNLDLSSIASVRTSKALASEVAKEEPKRHRAVAWNSLVGLKSSCSLARHTETP